MAEPTDGLGPTLRPASARIAEFDGLRGILAWCVVGNHLLLCNGFFEVIVHRHPRFAELGLSALDLFMLLSGFVITRLLIVGREPFGPFIWRRACRIVPAYWVALIAGILLNGVLADNFRRLPAQAGGESYAAVCDLGAARLWIDGPLHALMWHGLVPMGLLPLAAYTLIGAGWTVSLEWQFYWVAPCLLRDARKQVSAFVVLALACAVATFFSEKIIVLFSYAFLPAKIGFYFVGALSFVAFSGPPEWRYWLRWFVCPCACLSAIALAGSGRLIESLLPVLMWCIVIGSARFGTFPIVRKSLDSRPLQALGRWSYSTYLFHVPVITILQACIWRIIRPTSSTQLFFWTAASTIPVVLLVSVASWRWIEVPFQRFGRTKNRQPPAANAYGPAA